jgi:hypothetical protein
VALGRGQAHARLDCTVLLMAIGVAPLQVKLTDIEALIA